MIVPGQRVRHRKQPGWGIGVVSSIKPGALVELVIDFADTQRLLKLKPEVIDAMIEPVSADENAAIDAREAAAAKAARAKAKARSARMKSTRLEPRHKLEMSCTDLESAGDGTALLAISSDEASGFRIYAADASLVEDIAAPEPGREYVVFSPGARFVPTELVTDGNGLFVGKRTHNPGDVVFVRRGMKTARMWRAPIEMGSMRIEVRAGTDPVIHCSDHVFIGREDGTARQVPLALGAQRHLGGAVGWGDGVLLVVHGPTGADEYFNYMHVDLDGGVRHQGPGMAATPVDDEVMVTTDHLGALARDRHGRPTGRLDVRVHTPSSMNHREVAFVKVDDELVFALDGEVQGLVRWHPRVDQPRWVAKLTTAPYGFETPIRVGRFLAVTNGAYSGNPDGSVWIVDAETGALVHELPLRRTVSKLVAVGDDALVAVSSKHPVAWRGLSTARPERFTLASECHDAVSPAPGVVITNDFHHVCFFDL